MMEEGARAAGTGAGPGAAVRVAVSTAAVVRVGAAMALSRAAVAVGAEGLVGEARAAVAAGVGSARVARVVPAGALCPPSCSCFATLRRRPWLALARLRISGPSS